MVAGLAAVHARIAAACSASGREENSVRLLAVSKRHPAAAIREAYAEGQRDFGESYVQEMVGKREELSDLVDLRFHMIGHLQRNKAQAVCAVANVVHSVDSVRLAQTLGQRASQRSNFKGPLEVLVQVKLSVESEKTGCAPEELQIVLETVEAQESLRLKGLMTIGQRGAADPSEQFRRLGVLREAHGGMERLPELSMGMSGDLEQAIAEGSTWVRVGTDIFGQRG